MTNGDTNLSHDLKRDKRLARRELAASLMSNTKWRVLFKTLQAPELAIRQIKVKFTDGPEVKCMELPWLSAPYAFVDSMSFGPFPLVSLEWIEVPAEAVFPVGDGATAKRHVQNLFAVRAALEATGKRFVFGEAPDGLRIVGHAP